jgi:hypothetical protein
MSKDIRPRHPLPARSGTNTRESMRGLEETVGSDGYRNNRRQTHTRGRSGGDRFGGLILKGVAGASTLNFMCSSCLDRITWMIWTIDLQHCAFP